MFMHYTGKLQDGSVFDSSLSRDPFEFTIGKSALIEGMQVLFLFCFLSFHLTIINVAFYYYFCYFSDFFN